MEFRSNPCNVVNPFKSVRFVVISVLMPPPALGGRPVIVCQTRGNSIVSCLSGASCFKVNLPFHLLPAMYEKTAAGMVSAMKCTFASAVPLCGNLTKRKEGCAWGSKLFSSVFSLSPERFGYASGIHPFRRVLPADETQRRPLIASSLL